MRLPQDNIESSFMTGLMEGVRGRGKPRIRWLEGVDWPICDQATASSTRQSSLENGHSSALPSFYSASA